MTLPLATIFENTLARCQLTPDASLLCQQAFEAMSQKEQELFLKQLPTWSDQKLGRFFELQQLKSGALAIRDQQLCEALLAEEKKLLSA